MRVFAFLDLNYPPVAWAVMRGMMVSADAVGPNKRGFISFMHAGILEHENNARLFNESVIESVRIANFPKQISRMRGFYFFRSKEEAESRIGDRNWPKYFIAENLLECELYCSAAPTVVDANWITFAPLVEDRRIDVDNLDWIRKYWAGEQFNETPAWELLATGTAIILDPEVRRRCFEFVKREFPDSHIPILMARLASEAGTDGGLITPFLLREDNQHFRLGHVWSDAEFHDPAVIAKIAAHPDAPFLGRLMAENEEWKSPDFRPWGRVFLLGEQSRAGRVNSILASSAHHVRDAFKEP